MPPNAKNELPKERPLDSANAESLPKQKQELKDQVARDQFESHTVTKNDFGGKTSALVDKAIGLIEKFKTEIPKLREKLAEILGASGLETIAGFVTKGTGMDALLHQFLLDSAASAKAIWKDVGGLLTKQGLRYVPSAQPEAEMQKLAELEKRLVAINETRRKEGYATMMKPSEFTHLMADALAAEAKGGTYDVAMALKLEPQIAKTDLEKTRAAVLAAKAQPVTPPAQPAPAAPYKAA